MSEEVPVLDAWPAHRLPKPYRFIAQGSNPERPWVYVYQTDAMPAPAFHYYPTLDDAIHRRRAEQPRLI